MKGSNIPVQSTEMGTCTQGVINFTDIVNAICFFRTSVIRAKSSEVVCDILKLDGKIFKTYNINIMCNEGWKARDKTNYTCIPENPPSAIIMAAPDIDNKKQGIVRSTPSLKEQAKYSGETTSYWHAWFFLHEGSWLFVMLHGIRGDNWVPGLPWGYLRL